MIEWFFYDWLLSLQSDPRKDPMIQLNVTARDPEGHPIPGAIVTLFTFDAAGKPCPVEPAIRNWANFYASEGAYAPAGAHPPFTVYGSATAPGYGVSYIPMTPWDGTSTLELSVTLSLFKRPFKPAPRAWAGQMCGMRIPGLPSVAGGADDPSLFLSWFYDRYPTDIRDGLLRPALKARGYLDVLLSWPDARAAGGTPASFLAICRELVADGLRPCVMLCSKLYDPHDDAAGILANIAPVLPLLVGLVPRFCVGWELNLWNSPQTVATLRDTLAPQWLKQAGTLGYVHFGPGVFAWQPDGFPSAVFWQASVGKIHGVLHQRDPEEDHGRPSEYQARIADCLVRFAGGFGFPIDSGFGGPFDFIALEITASEQFDGQMSETAGDAWGRVAIATPPAHGPAGTVPVGGSGNGA